MAVLHFSVKYRHGVYQGTGHRHRGRIFSACFCTAVAATAIFKKKERQKIHFDISFTGFIPKFKLNAKSTTV